MTPTEAHNHTMEVVKSLQAKGIETEVKPYKIVDNVLDKYGPDGTKSEGRANPDLWCNVTFKPKNDEQANLIQEMVVKLGWMGVTFDTGGGCGRRDWELDWSFKYKEGCIDSRREEALTSMEDFIKGMDNAESED